MATQRIIVAKIGGAAGFAAMQTLLHLRSSLESRRGSNHRNGQHPKRPQTLKTFVASLRANSSTPPVIFFAEYVDFWSMGDDIQRCFPRRRSPSVVKASEDEVEVLGYRLPDGGALQRHVKRLLRAKAVNEPAAQERRWLLSIVLHALDSWSALLQDGALVVVRELLGGLLEDSDIEKALERVPRWIAQGARSRKG